MFEAASARWEVGADAGVKEEDIIDGGSCWDAEIESVGEQEDVLCFAKLQCSKTLAD